MKRIYPLSLDVLQSWSPALAYILGFTVTDGCVEENDYKVCARGRDHIMKQRVVSWQLLDREPLEVIQRHVCPDKPIEVCERKHGTFFRFRLCGQDVVDLFKSYGIYPRKTLTARVNDIPSDLFYHYLRGVIDGDGSIVYRQGSKPNRNGYTRIAVTISSGSLEFLHDLQQITTGGAISKGSGCMRISFDCGNAVNLLKSVYADSENLRLTRKYDTWCEFLGLGQTYRTAV